MKFDGPGIIGFHAGVLNTASFARLIKINHTKASGYLVIFQKSDGHGDYWCICSDPSGYTDKQYDFIEIGGIRYEGDMLTTFCEAFMTMKETEKAIDSLEGQNGGRPDTRQEDLFRKGRLRFLRRPDNR